MSNKQKSKAGRFHDPSLTHIVARVAQSQESILLEWSRTPDIGLKIAEELLLEIDIEGIIRGIVPGGSIFIKTAEDWEPGKPISVVTIYGPDSTAFNLLLAFWTLASDSPWLDTVDLNESLELLGYLDKIDTTKE